MCFIANSLVRFNKPGAVCSSFVFLCEISVTEMEVLFTITDSIQDTVHRFVVETARQAVLIEKLGRGSGEGRVEHTRDVERERTLLNGLGYERDRLVLGSQTGR